MKKWIISIAVIIVLIGGGTAAYSYYHSKTTETQAPQVQIQTAAAETGTIEVSVSGTGNISAINKEMITSEGNATVDEVLVAVGDTVAAGDELITFEDDKLDPITASFAGEVTTLNVAALDSVQMGAELIEVTDYSNLEMVVNIDELDIDKVQVGQSANIDVSALADSEFTGTVTSVAKEANSDSSSTIAKYEVNITINEPTGIKVGMTAEATITTEKKENIVTVPFAAVQKDDDGYYVLVPSEDQTTAKTAENDSTTADDSTSSTIKTTKQSIEIGLQNATAVEVVKGITKGDTVVLPSLNSNSSSNSNNKQSGNSFFPSGNMGQGPQGGMPPADRNSQGGNGQ